MFLSKAVPDGMKTIECEHVVGGKNTPICYIPKQYPIQDVIKTKHQPTSSI
jgi:hypothetical protein